MTVAFPTLKDVRLLPSRGPWKTKSGGALMQHLQLNWAEVQRHVFQYPSGESHNPDIRGLRIYTVMEIPRGTIGAREFHRVRTEIVFPIHGTFRWTCTDMHGERKDFRLDGQHAILVPPFILHEYESLKKDGALVVLATTTFEPNEPSTHDSYSVEAFTSLQHPT
jgi:hypothetical protein